MLNDISLCYKDPNEPGPGQYDPKLPQKHKTGKYYPFGSNLQNERPLRLKEMCPAPGRYNPKTNKNIPGFGWTSVFKSKVPRTQNIAKESYNSF